jgi:hypothetical protein
MLVDSFASLDVTHSQTPFPEKKMNIQLEFGIISMTKNAFKMTRRILVMASYSSEYQGRMKNEIVLRWMGKETV